MKIKKSKDNKTEFIGLRLNQADMNKIKTKANLYNDGNVSGYVLKATLNYDIKMDDLDIEKGSK